MVPSESHLRALAEASNSSAPASGPTSSGAAAQPHSPDQPPDDRPRHARSAARQQVPAREAGSGALTTAPKQPPGAKHLNHLLQAALRNSHAQSSGGSPGEAAAQPPDSAGELPRLHRAGGSEAWRSEACSLLGRLGSGTGLVSKQGWQTMPWSISGPWVWRHPRTCWCLPVCLGMACVKTQRSDAERWMRTRRSATEVTCQHPILLTCSCTPHASPGRRLQPCSAAESWEERTATRSTHPTATTAQRPPGTRRSKRPSSAAQAQDA